MKILIPIFCFLIIGLNSLLGQSKEDLNVVFSEIDVSEYIQYKKEFSNNLILDSTKNTIPDSSFSLIIKNREQLFDCQKDYNGCHYYRGFLPALNSFVITRCGMHTCTTFLMNQTSGEIHQLYSPYDSECKAPLLSKDQTKLLVYSSSVFDTKSFISIYKRTESTKDFDLKSYKSRMVKKWRIHEAVWIDDSSFAIMTFEKYGGKTGSKPLNVTYIKGILK